MSKSKLTKVAAKLTKGVAKAKATCTDSAPRWMLVVAFTLIALLAATLVFQFLIRPSVSRIPTERFQTDAGAAQQPQKGSIVFFHMNGCGWCDRFRPTWDDFVGTYGGALKAQGVAVLDFEAGDEEGRKYKDQVQGYVQGYPTVLFIPAGGGQPVKFQDERTVEKLRAFVEENGVALGRGSAATTEKYTDRFDAGIASMIKNVKTHMRG
jgi:thiol-disulfide isomerase/thioredoxin